MSEIRPIDYLYLYTHPHGHSKKSTVRLVLVLVLVLVLPNNSNSNSNTKSPTQPTTRNHTVTTSPPHRYFSIQATTRHPFSQSLQLSSYDTSCSSPVDSLPLEPPKTCQTAPPNPRNQLSPRKILKSQERTLGRRQHDLLQHATSQLRPTHPPIHQRVRNCQQRLSRKIRQLLTTRIVRRTLLA